MCVCVCVCVCVCFRETKTVCVCVCVCPSSRTHTLLSLSFSFSQTLRLSLASCESRNCFGYWLGHVYTRALMALPTASLIQLISKQCVGIVHFPLTLLCLAPLTSSPTLSPCTLTPAPRLADKSFAVACTCLSLSVPFLLPFGVGSSKLTIMFAAATFVSIFVGWGCYFAMGWDPNGFNR